MANAVCEIGHRPYVADAGTILAARWLLGATPQADIGPDIHDVESCSRLNADGRGYSRIDLEKVGAAVRVVTEISVRDAVLLELVKDGRRLLLDVRAPDGDPDRRDAELVRPGPPFLVHAEGSLDT